MKSDVYFIEVEETDTQTRCSALLRLLHKTEGILTYKRDEFVPVKLTVGDSQCIYNISPELVKLVIAQIKKKKAKPFLFDTNVIYKGERQNAVDHLNLIQSKGFATSITGAPYIIADGLLGQDGREFEIDSPLIKKIKLPSFVGMLESLLVLSHITGHILTGYAGAIKNVAMGMVCRATKQVQHSSLKPHIIRDRCTLCRRCIDICPAGAIQVRSDKTSINQTVCMGCGECLCVCQFDAIFVNWNEDDGVFAMRIAEVAKFILSKFKNKFFINFAFDITKECDCISTKNEKIISKNIGILASEDILSVDKATLDLIHNSGDLFRRERPGNFCKKMFEYTHNSGAGSLEYNLIKL